MAVAACSGPRGGASSAEFRELLVARNTAAADADTAALRPMLADDLIWVIGATSEAVGKAQLLAAAGTPQNPKPRFDVDSVHVHQIHDVAVVDYRRTDHRRVGTFEDSVAWRVFELFERTGGQWLVARHDQAWLGGRSLRRWHSIRRCWRRSSGATRSAPATSTACISKGQSWSRRRPGRPRARICSRYRHRPFCRCGRPAHGVRARPARPSARVRPGLSGRTGDSRSEARLNCPECNTPVFHEPSSLRRLLLPSPVWHWQRRATWKCPLAHRAGSGRGFDRARPQADHAHGRRQSVSHSNARGLERRQRHGRHGRMGVAHADSIATVSSAGVVHAIGQGSTTITASVVGKAGTVKATLPVSVSLVPVDSVVLTPSDSLACLSGGTVQFFAKALDADGMCSSAVWSPGPRFRAASPRSTAASSSVSGRERRRSRPRSRPRSRQGKSS